MPIVTAKECVPRPARIHSAALIPLRLRCCAFTLALLAVLVLPGSGAARDITWQDAVAQLAAERTRAETCVTLLKRHAGEDTATLSRGELAFSEAKAEVDAVIAGLVVVLAQSGTPPDLAALEARLTRGVEARRAFCTRVESMLPENKGTKNVLVSIVGAALEPLIEAVVELYKFETEQDQLLRRTIQTQLEATRWSDFADIQV